MRHDSAVIHCKYCMLPPVAVAMRVKARAGAREVRAAYLVEFDIKAYAVEAVETAIPVCETHAIEGLRAFLKEIR